MGSRGPVDGNSEGTRRKEELFGAALGLHMKIERGARCFFHLDLNAGHGFNSKAKVVGTPLIFLRQAEKYQDLLIRAVFVDRRQDFLKELETRINGIYGQQSLLGRQRVRVQYRVQDNEDACRRMPSWVTQCEEVLAFASGCILSDPNGVHDATRGTAVPIAVLAATAAKLPRFLILAHVNVGASKRVRGSHRKRPDLGCGYPLLADYLSMRRHWLISEPWNRMGHVCLAGTHYSMRDWARIGWHHLQSSRGREIAAWADSDDGRSLSRRMNE